MRYYHYLLMFLITIAASWLILDTVYEGRSNDNWTAPYFSAAANLSLGGDFLVDDKEVLAFKELEPRDQYQYNFHSSDSLAHYNHNPVGFAYIIWISTHIFPFAGDIYALLYLQLIIHLLLCALLMRTIQNKVFQIVFFFIYCINPLVLNIVVLNYYYFWQCIPGFIMVYLLAANKINRRILIALTALLILTTLARPTVILLAMFILFLYFKYAGRIFAWTSIATFFFAILILNKPTEKNIWHTIYVGIAAYPNDAVQTLSDDTGYALYKEKTGHELNASFGENYYDKAVIQNYKTITKSEVVRILQEHPLMFIRNGALNFFQCYSIGYVNLNNYGLNIVSALLGLIFLILLLISRQFLIAIGILLSSITFSLYYPPIQAYLFGAYILSAFGLFGILNYFFKSKVNYTLPSLKRKENEKPDILYICNNDGSDMRINKELKTLSEHYTITFVGVGTTNLESYARHYCKYFYLVIGRRNRLLTVLKQVWLVLKLRPEKFDSIHIINEQLMIFFYPFLFGQHVVLDIFDSIFLMWNKSKEKWRFIKKIVYAPVNVILVTDNNRLQLMPKFTHDKIHVLENFPLQYNHPINKIQHPENLTILYSGWLGRNRGTDVVYKLLEADNTIRIILAGWFADEASRTLAQHPQVDYRGIMTQEESHNIAAEEADFILGVYAPINENNINASPNKVYDAIQTSTPIIINKEIKIAGFVEENKIGVIIDDYYNFDPRKLVAHLKETRNTFNFSAETKKKYTWENIDHILVEAHKA